MFIAWPKFDILYYRNCLNISTMVWRLILLGIPFGEHFSQDTYVCQAKTRGNLFVLFYYLRLSPLYLLKNVSCPLFYAVKMLSTASSVFFFGWITTSSRVMCDVAVVSRWLPVFAMCPAIVLLWWDWASCFAFVFSGSNRSWSMRAKAGNTLPFLPPDIQLVGCLGIHFLFSEIIDRNRETARVVCANVKPWRIYVCVKI